jgi:APA family basic amino acid/polyamine antiporter
MSSALPRSGASFEWPSRFVHPLVGFLVAWLRILGSIGAVIVLATVLVNYLQMAGIAWIEAVPDEAAMAVVISAIFLINILGVSVAARAQTAMMLVLLAALALFVGTGVGDMSAARAGDPLAAGWPAILAAVPLMITLFLGIESATEIGEEVRDARRTIPRGITLAVLLTAAVYFAVSIVALGLLGPDALAGSDAPLLEAARVGMGDWAIPVIVTAAVVSILKTMNAIVLIFSRYLFAMGRSLVLPASMGVVNARFGTPHVALGVAYVGVMAALLLPSNLVFLLLAVNIPTMLKYLCSCLAAIGLVRRHPELHAGASLRWSRRSVETASIAGVVAAVAVILAGLGADWRPYVLVGAWGLVGYLYWLVRRPRVPAAGDPAPSA